MHLVSLGAPERQFVDFCALRTLFDLCWDCTLWVALTANRERRTRLRVNDGDHLPGKTAKKLVIGLIPVCRQLAQFLELGLWQFNNDVEPNIRVTRPGKVASGVNVGGGHIQGRLFFCTTLSRKPASWAKDQRNSVDFFTETDRAGALRKSACWRAASGFPDFSGKPVKGPLRKTSSNNSVST